MIAYFADPAVTISTKLVRVMFMLSGVFCIYTGLMALREEEKKDRFSTCFYWCILGILASLGYWLPKNIDGALVFAMCIPAIFKKVRKNSLKTPTQDVMEANFKKIGFKLFIPAFTVGIISFILAMFFPKINALVGTLIGTVFGIAFLMITNKDNSPKAFLEEGRRFMGFSGTVFLLPMLLACLGAVFTKAGVGDTLSGIFGRFIPEQNVYIGIICYAVGMMLFTMIMGNAFAAITVLTTAIGVPFVIANGANPLYMVAVAMTCGYCGTLITPMAGNFNMLPLAYLEIKDKYGMIKKQAIPAFCMLAFQIVYMMIMK